jgi:hypothetical protein
MTGRPPLIVEPSEASQRWPQMGRRLSRESGRLDLLTRGRLVEISWRLADYVATEYFAKEVLRKRPYLKKEWCIPSRRESHSF